MINEPIVLPGLGVAMRRGPAAVQRLGCTIGCMSERAVLQPLLLRPRERWASEDAMTVYVHKLRGQSGLLSARL
jgi:hypothetical protein